MQYQVSYWAAVSLVGSFAAWRDRSLSGVVSALTSTLEMSPSVPESSCTRSSGAYIWPSSSPPASYTPTISYDPLSSLPETFRLSPADTPSSSASATPTITFSASAATDSSSQRPSTTSHHERMLTTPASSSSPVGSDRWWLYHEPTMVTSWPFAFTCASINGAKSTMLKAQKIVFTLPSSSSLKYDAGTDDAPSTSYRSLTTLASFGTTVMFEPYVFSSAFTLSPTSNMTASMAVASDAPSAIVKAIMNIFPFWRSSTPAIILRNIRSPPYLNVFSYCDSPSVGNTM